MISGNYERAIVDFTQAIKINPFELASADFKQYLELASNTPDRAEVVKLIEQLKAELKND